MRIKKIFISVFLLTFIIGIIGYFFVQPTKKVSTLPEIVIAAPQDLPLPLFEVKPEFEIIEENNDWRNVDDSKFNVKLLETGDGFHGDQINAKTGEIWLGLFEEKGKAYLEPVKLVIRRVYDPIVDGNNEEEVPGKTGKSVSVDKKSEPVFLLKNAKMLSQGNIQTLYSYNDTENSTGEDTSIRNGFVKEFKMGEVTYILRAKKGKNKNQEDILALVLESGSISQTLHSLQYFGEGDYLGSLYWAGDLDRDGKPDFYFSLYFNDNAEYRNLFLSSQASKRKLVKKIATFTTTGC